MFRRCWHVGLCVFKVFSLISFTQADTSEWTGQVVLQTQQHLSASIFSDGKSGKKMSTDRTFEKSTQLSYLSVCRSTLRNTWTSNIIFNLSADSTTHISTRPPFPSLHCCSYLLKPVSLWSILVEDHQSDRTSSVTTDERKIICWSCWQQASL